jgi:hypothetical protein
MSTLTARDRVRNAITENVGLKLLSLACAIGFYAFIHGAGDAQRTFSVGVILLRPPDSENRELLQPPTEIGLVLRGPRSQLDDLKADDLGSLQLDLRSGRDTRVDLDPTMFHVPAGLVIEQIIPQAITLRWDDVIQRSIPVQVTRTGELAAGFTMKGPITTEPAAIQSHGPRSMLETMQFVAATPFDTTGLSGGVFRRPLAISKPPSFVTFDTETVVATVEIVRELKTTKFSRLKVEVVGVPRAQTVPGTVTVLITGTPEDVNSILPEAIVPRVEPKAAGADLTKPNSMLLDVLVDVPRAKAEVEPKQVLVKW